jgi:hypothetical protein
MEVVFCCSDSIKRSEVCELFSNHMGILFFSQSPKSILVLIPKAGSYSHKWEESRKIGES